MCYGSPSALLGILRQRGLQSTRRSMDKQTKRTLTRVSSCNHLIPTLPPSSTSLAIYSTPKPFCRIWVTGSNLGDCPRLTVSMEIQWEGHGLVQVGEVQKGWQCPWIAPLQVPPRQTRLQAYTAPNLPLAWTPRKCPWKPHCLY